MLVHAVQQRVSRPVAIQFMQGRTCRRRSCAARISGASSSRLARSKWSIRRACTAQGGQTSARRAAEVLMPGVLDRWPQVGEVQANSILVRADMLLPKT